MHISNNVHLFLLSHDVCHNKEALWRFFYRRSGVSRLVFKKYVATYFELINVNEGTTLDTRWLFFFFFLELLFVYLLSCLFNLTIHTHTQQLLLYHIRWGGWYWSYCFWYDTTIYTHFWFIIWYQTCRSSFVGKKFIQQRSKKSKDDTLHYPRNLSNSIYWFETI